MKTFIADIIPKIQRFSQRLDDLTKLTNQHWVSLGDITQTKRVFIFRANNQLLIADNGIVEKGSWEYLGNQSLLMDTKHESYLLKHGFFDENVIALKLDSTDNYAFFINETKYKKDLNTIEDVLSFLEDKYIKSPNILSQASYRNSNNFRVSNQFDSFTIKYGFCTVYEVSFDYGSYGKVYRKKSNNKYCYYDEIYGDQEADTLENAINNLYQSIKEKNNR